MAEQRQSRERGQHEGRSEVLLPRAERLGCRLLVGRGQVVHVALEVARVTLQRPAQQQPVLGVALPRQQVHERAVVDAVQPQRPHEVALQQPERLGYQQRVRRPGGHRIDHLAPELARHRRLELRLAEGVTAARGDRSTLAGRRVPQPPHVPLHERHGGVEPDHLEAPGDLHDRLDDRRSHLWLEVVELRGVVPRHRGPVVAVIRVAHAPRGALPALEDDRGVAAVVVPVLDPHLDAAAGREVGAGERVAGEGRGVERKEPLGVLGDPAGVEPGVVRHHVAGQAQPVPLGPRRQLVECGVAAELLGDHVVEDRVGAGLRERLTAQPLYRLGRFAALPDPHQPQGVETLGRQGRERFVRHLVEPVDPAAVPL